MKTGTSFSGVVAPGSMLAVDRAAHDIVEKLTDFPEAARQYLLTVARGEGFFGHGWAHPSPRTVSASQAHGLTGYEGKDSHNWGAIQGHGDAGSFPHVDYHADGTAYVGQYKKYSTPEAGARDMAHVLLKPNVVAAAVSGDLAGAVNAQHSNHYFELDPAKYLAAVKKNYEVLTSNVGWKPLLVGAAKSGWGLALAVAGIVLGSVLFLRLRR